MWLLNSCTVKNPAEDHFRNEINKGRQMGKYVVIAGCVPQGAPKLEYTQVNYVMECTAKPSIDIHDCP